MFKQPLSHPTRTRLTAVMVLVLMLAGMPSAALAQANVPDATEGRINDNVLEFGVWWVEDYPPAGPGGADLPATRPDALGLRDFLTSTCKVRLFGICFTNWSSPVWTPRFVYGNSNAWASDWRASGGTAAGNENFYIDTIDLAYFAGHGSSNGISFGAGSPTPTFMNKSQVVNAWGDRDLDWIGLAACNTLDNPMSNLQSWGQTMNGVRLIMGFQTVMNDVPHGREFGRYIRDGYSFTQAWFKAADKLQSQNRVARVLAEQEAYFNDKPAQHNAFTLVNWPKYFRTHTVGSEPARYVDIAQLGGEMPVLVVQPLDLEGGELDALINSLESAFGLTITVPENGDTRISAIQAVLEGDGLFYSEDGTLELDGNYGLFLQTDRDNLWAVNPESAQMAAAGVPMMVLTEEDAKAIADSFLGQAGLMPRDAQFFEVAPDTQTTFDEVVTAAGDTTVAVTAEATTNYQVIYSRIISYTPSLGVAGASNEEVGFSVMGPGSKLKVYVDTQVPDGLSTAEMTNQGVLGGMGGYRKIMDPVAAAEAGALRTVSMLPIPVIEKLFNSDLEATVSLDFIPLSPEDFISRTVTSITPAYWEGAMGFNQGELFPVYAIEIVNTMRDADDGSYPVPSTSYIPVNPEYMAPLARILTDEDLSGNIVPGKTLVFEAMDAGKTLQELGLDPDPENNPLDFNLGTQGGLFLYEWYLNEISEETKLGVDRVLEYTVENRLGVDAKDGTQGTQRIILVVTDTDNNNQGNNSSQAVVTLNAVPPLFLPGLFVAE